MQEKVLVYLKSHFQGIATAILVLIAIFIGYTWGNGNFNDVEQGDIIIEEVVSTSTDTGVPVSAPVTNVPAAPVKKYVVTKKATAESSASTTIVTSDNIAPIPAATTTFPLYFFYGAGAGEVSSPAPVQNND